MPSPRGDAGLPGVPADGARRHPDGPGGPTADAAFDLEILVLLSTTINFLDAPALEALGPAIGQALSAALTALPLHPTRRAPDVLQHALELSDGVFTLIEAVGLRGGPAAVAVYSRRGWTT